jgi:superfamily II DNA or RNA helicase
MSDLIEQGYLSRFRVFAPSHPDLIGVKIVAGDYQEKELSKRMSEPQLVADVVSNWLERANGEPTILFAVDRAHAAILHSEFEKSGVRSAYVDCKTPREERLEIFKSFQNGDTKIICNVATLGTGLDLDVRCIIYARPTRSEMRFVQDIGRALRTAPGKAVATIFDHSDTTLTLGMVTDIDHDELCSGRKLTKYEKEAKEQLLPKPKECQACHHLMPIGAKECPECGHVQKIVSNVKTIEGELLEVGAGSKAQKREPIVATLRKLKRQELFGQIVDEQINRGKQDGWAAHLYKSIHGTWPGNQLLRIRRPASFALLSYIRSRNIAFSKSQKAVRHGF